jgi:hypothetical protein
MNTTDISCYIKTNSYANDIVSTHSADFTPDPLEEVTNKASKIIGQDSIGSTEDLNAFTGKREKPTAALAGSIEPMFKTINEGKDTEALDKITCNYIFDSSSDEQLNNNTDKSENKMSNEKRSEYENKIAKNNASNEAYHNLSKDDQNKFLLLMSQSEQSEQTKGIFYDNLKDTSKCLMNLLADGKLSNKDSQGNTLIQNLSQFENAKFPRYIKDGDLIDDNNGKINYSNEIDNGNYNKNLLFGELVAKLNNPAAINQAGQGSCGPTVNEIKLAMEYPSEFARISLGLCSEDGKVHLQNGDIMTRYSGVGELKGRSLIDTIIQSSFFEYANGSETYDEITNMNTPDNKQENAYFALRE